MVINGNRMATIPSPLGQPSNNTHKLNQPMQATPMMLGMHAPPAIQATRILKSIGQKVQQAGLIQV